MADWPFMDRLFHNMVMAEGMAYPHGFLSMHVFDSHIPSNRRWDGIQRNAGDQVSSPGTQDEALTQIYQCNLRSACALVLLLGVAVMGLFAQTQSPSLFAANVVREALKEKGVLPKMTAIPRTSNEMRVLVIQALDRRLLNHLESLSGCDFEYQRSDSGQMRSINVIVFEYSTTTMAKQMAAILGPHSEFHGMFHLAAPVYYSAARLGRLLVVTSVESTGSLCGNDRITMAVMNLSSDFAKASESGTIRWGEPDTVQEPK